MDVEALLGSDGELHVVWGTDYGDSSGADRLWYSHSGGDHSRWSAPQLVESSYSRALKLVEVGSRLHLFASGFGGLRHLSRDPMSGRWLDEGSLADRVDGFDALANGSGIVVAYWSTDTEAVVSPDMPLKMVVADIRESGEILRHDLGKLARAHPLLLAGPRLASWRNETHVVWSSGSFDSIPGGYDRRFANGAWQGTPGGGLWTVPRCKVVEAYRESTGGAWATNAGIWPDSLGNKVSDLLLLAAPDRLFLFFNGQEASESPDGRHWSPPARLTNTHVVGWNAAIGWKLAACADSNAVVLTWIDNAIAASKMIAPGALSDPYLETDAFALVCTRRPTTLANLRTSKVVRVTRRTGFAQGVIARSGPGGPEVVWYGSNYETVPILQIGVAHLAATGSW